MLIAQSGIDSDRYQELLASGRFSDLLLEFTIDKSAEPEQVSSEPTITPIRVSPDYTRTLIQMRNAGGYDGPVNPDLNDTNFPVEVGESGEREFFLVCFHRKVGDHEDPNESELLRELDKLGLKPEGPAELCAVGEHHPELQRKFPIVARRQAWRDPRGFRAYMVLGGNVYGRSLQLIFVRRMWENNCRFLCSRKPVANGDSK